MAAVNKHGIKMVGLRKAAGETKGLPVRNCYVQISYDRADGTILTNWHCSIGGNSWTVYHDDSVITVATACYPKTMQEIADVIARAVNDPANCY